MNRHVVITAYSVINDMGKNKQEVEEGIFSGKSGLSKHQFEYGDGITEGCFGLVHDLTEVHDFFKQHNLPFDRCSQLALMGADDCMRESGLDVSAEDPHRLGVSIGTSLGCMRSGDAFHKEWIEKGAEAANPAWLIEYPMHTVTDIVAMSYSFRGCKNTISTACAAGANALGYAYDLIMNGSHDAILAGGVDPVSSFSFAGFTALKAIDKGYCRPYSASTGINLAEGAAFFLLEEEEHAVARGAKIFARFLGYGITADAYHQTAPEPGGGGALRAMTSALNLSGVPVEDISYVNGHGTGTPTNDAAESNAVSNLLRERISEVPLSSTKGATGHCLGAAGSVECAICIMAINKDMIPPTIRFDEEKYPLKDINYVPNRAISQEVNVVMSNSFAFGGNNCCVVLGKPAYHCDKPKLTEDRIVITGIGCVGTGGTNPKELFGTFEHRLRPVKAIEGFDTSFFTCKSIIACKEPDYKRLVPLKFLRRTDEITKLTMASGKQALDSAQITVSRHNMERIGVIYGTGAGPVETLEAINRDATVHGISAVNPASFPNSVLNQAAGNFCIAHMLKGPSSTVTGSLASLMQAFFYACELLRNDHADACVVIGSDECNEPLLLGYDKVGLLSSNNLPPLAEGADGMLFSKGSVAFVLEKESAAKKRNANVLATVLSAKCCSDNSELKHVDPKGIELKYCVNEAIKQAGIERTDLYVSSACGIAEFDSAESDLIASLPKETRVSCPQAMLGTPLGASGGYGILNALYTFSSGKVTGMPDGDYALNQKVALRLKKGENEAADVKTACISSAGFGGTYVSVVLGNGTYGS